MTCCKVIGAPRLTASSWAALGHRVTTYRKWVCRMSSLCCFLHPVSTSSCQSVVSLLYTPSSELAFLFRKGEMPPHSPTDSSKCERSPSDTSLLSACLLSVSLTFTIVVAPTGILSDLCLWCTAVDRSRHWHRAAPLYEARVNVIWRKVCVQYMCRISPWLHISVVTGKWLHTCYVWAKVGQVFINTYN